MLTFPEGFLWGTATAAHQVEGGNDNNDWWDWESVPGHIKNGDRSTVACDWWKGARYQGDLDFAQAMHLNAQRFSIEWSRLEPSDGKWDGQAFAYYRRVLMAVRQRGMIPLVTLHHFTNPRWLVEKGAWETEAVIPLFERFVGRAVEELGDLCDFWITINEPNVYLFSGYINGNWPPGKKNMRLAMRVGQNMIRGHAAAYRAIHHAQPNARVGMAHNIHSLYPQNPKSWANRTLVAFQDRTLNYLIPLALMDGKLRLPMGVASQVPEAVGTQDFIAMHYYFSIRIALDWSRPSLLFARELPPRPWGVSFENDLQDWFGYGDLDPNGFAEALKWLTRFGRPIYVTENGICDPTDEIRPRYLVTHLAALHSAIQAGAPVHGYFHWSLVDNFEWKEGYSLRFGLVENDYATQRRTPRGSAQIYGRIVEENGIPDELCARYGTLEPMTPAATSPTK